MAYIWNKEDFPLLADANFIDRIGHFVHSNTGYRFEMPIMGYQALFYTQEFEELVSKESSIKALQPEVYEIRRGAFAKPGTEGWELSFQAKALIRNQLDLVTKLPVGKVDYATDLSYSNTILYSTNQEGLQIFLFWAQTHGLALEEPIIEEIISHQTTEFQNGEERAQLPNHI